VCQAGKEAVCQPARILYIARIARGSETESEHAKRAAACACLRWGATAPGWPCAAWCARQRPPPPAPRLLQPPRAAPASGTRGGRVASDLGSKLRTRGRGCSSFLQVIPTRTKTISSFSAVSTLTERPFSVSIQRRAVRPKFSLPSYPAPTHPPPTVKQTAKVACRGPHLWRSCDRSARKVQRSLHFSLQAKFLPWASFEARVLTCP